MAAALAPADLLAWLFNPIFQTLFLVLAFFYSIFGDVGIAIILLTLAIKTFLIPLTRAQIVSQRRMQLIQPEIRVIQHEGRLRGRCSHRRRGWLRSAGCDGRGRGRLGARTRSGRTLSGPPHPPTRDP